MKKLLILYILIISGVNLSYSQAALEIRCIVDLMDGNVAIGASVQVYEDNTIVKTIRTDSKGEFEVALDFGKNYKIVVTKEGMVNKRIDFQTDVPAEDQRRLINEFGMTLAEECTGADVSVFDEPVDVIKYDQGYGNFISDRAYFEQQRAKLLAANKSLKKCKDDKYYDNTKAAEEAIEDGRFEEAIELLNAALEARPNDPTARRKIGQVNKKIDDREVNNNRYDKLIKEAEEFLSQGKYDAALNRFESAGKLKPGETLPTQKISEINSIVAQAETAALEQQTLNNNYNSLVQKAQNAMAQENYPLAQQLYEQAAELKPSEAFPTQKIAEAQQALQQQQQRAQQIAETNKNYKDAMALGQAALQQQDFATAQQHFQQALQHKPTETLPRQLIQRAQKESDRLAQQELAEQKAEVERKYNEVIDRADLLLKEEKYSEATTAYQEALTIKPSDPYASQQINKVKNLLVEQQQTILAQKEREYDAAISKGNSLAIAKDFENAIAAYQQALIVKPNDIAANAKINEAKSLLADQQARLKEEQETKAQYNQLVQEADGLFQSEQWNEAKQKYQKALAIYPSETYPKNKIATIENTLAKNDKKAQYNTIISEADNLFNTQKYDEAKTAYNRALVMFPEERYPKQKLAEINLNLELIIKQATEEKYNQLIQNAENLVTQKQYEQAKAKLREAQQVIPENPFPQKRINEINELIIAESKSKSQQEYNQLAAEAEELINTQQYEQAKVIYRKAATVMPENQYPGQRINEINKLISDLERGKIDAEYNQLTQQAEEMALNKQYNQAIAILQKAATVKPENDFPTRRINEIKALIAASAKSAIEEKYDNLCAQAEEKVTSKQYELAKSLYTQAQQVIPENSYPQRRINEINEMISNDAKQAIVDKYNQIISEADNLFNQKAYQQAIAAYNRASTVIPEETYPQQKINEINALLVEQASRSRLEQETRAKYDAAVSLADRHFNDKNYELAKSEYNKALGIYPSEDYPKSQIERINQAVADENAQLAQQQELERQFNANINSADELFRQKKYLEAKGFYQKATELKPADVHANSQLRRIDDILNEVQLAQQRRQQIETQYNGFISTADDLFEQRKYINARKIYVNASNVKPNEAYPKSQIRKIDQFIRQIEQQRALAERARQTTTTTTTPPPTNTTPAKTGGTGATLKDIRIVNESERQKYLEELKSKFGEGVTLEIYKERNRTVKRWVVVRDNEVHEYREIRYSYGGVNYYMDGGKGTNSMYVKSQVKPRDGESYTEKEM